MCNTHSAWAIETYVTRLLIYISINFDGFVLERQVRENNCWNSQVNVTPIHIV